MDLNFWIETTGWAGMLLVLCGRSGIAYKYKWGFLLAIIGGTTVGMQAFLMNNFSIVLLCLILAGIDLQGWFYWRKHE